MTWIQTYTGIRFDLENPTPDMVCIEDIAQSLSLQCRFTGHVTRFYSVAQHCYYLSHLVPPEYALEALLHDAHEAYIGDLARPIKTVVDGWRGFEEKTRLAIAERYNLPRALSFVVQEYDLKLGKTEMLALFRDHHKAFLPSVEPIHPDRCPISPLNAGRARSLFRSRFNELYKEAEDATS